MADSFMGIFDSVSNSVSGLFEGISEVGTEVKEALGTSGGDFFGNKVSGAIFGGKSSSSSSSKKQSISLTEGQINRRMNMNSSTPTKPAAYADPRQLESEWTNRLFKFANMNKLVNNTKGEL